MKTFNIILAADLKGGIGLNNSLPWDFPLDKKYFRTMTTNILGENNILIVGRNTYQEFKNRNCYIVSKTLKGDNIFRTFHDAYMKASLNLNVDIWVIGGVKIYDAALKHFACDKVYFTLINNEFNSDVIFNIHNYNITWTNNIIRKDINKNDNIEYELHFKTGKVNHNVEVQYLGLLYNVFTTGNHKNTRNSLTYSKFNNTLSFNLQDGFPLLTTKKMFWKGIVEELLFFIRGETNSKLLLNKGIKIWEQNTTKEFINKMGLNYEEGDMGPMYGYQWRFFNKKYHKDDNNYIDQLVKIINEIKTDPNSRRILMTSFNPIQANEGVLYPCHSIILQFYVENKVLSCSMYQRSGDLFLGVPFNIASTSLLLHIIAKLTDNNVGMVNIILGDYHIYNDHIDAVIEQLERVPYNLCKLNIKNFKTLEEVENSTFDDYKIENYISHSIIKANMIA